MDRSWTLLPTRTQRYCAPASLIFLFLTVHLFALNSFALKFVIIFFCPRRKVFVGDYEVDMIRSLSVRLSVCLFKTFSYFWIQTSEVHETLPVLFSCQWELVYQFSEKFINFYYPLPIIFVVICYWT